MHYYLRSIAPEHNRWRHYLLTVQQDLEGRLVVVRYWGRIGSAWQGQQVTPAAGPQEATQLVQEILTRRRQHGYKIAEWLP